MRERGELGIDVQIMINTECLICQNSWTFLTMIKKTLGKINNTFSFHHIWILFLLKENDFLWIHSWFVLFKDIISRHFMIFYFRFLLFFKEKDLVYYILYMALPSSWFVFWISLTCQRFPSKIGITYSKVWRF